MRFNFDGLRELVARNYNSQTEFATAVELTPTQLALRLDGRLPFLASEIIRISEVLDIPGSEIGLYFFTPKFDKIELEGGFAI